jgi:hypothetical protein
MKASLSTVHYCCARSSNATSLNLHHRRRLRSSSLTLACFIVAAFRLHRGSGVLGLSARLSDKVFSSQTKLSH